MSLRRNLFVGAAAAPLLVALAAPAFAAAPTAGDLVVYRVGTGTGSLVNTGNPVFLDEYTPAGTLVQSIPLPTAAAGSDKPCIASGTATSEGLVNRSADGSTLLATCYGTATGGSASLSGTASTAVPRVVATLAADGTVASTTALTDWASANNPRSAASADGSALYLGGAAGGVRLAPVGATTSGQVESTTANVRDVVVDHGQLFYSTSSGTTGIYAVNGSGLPTTSQTATLIAASPSPYAFFFATLQPAATSPDTLYVADDSTNTIRKFSLVGSTWTATGSIAASGVRGLTGSVSGGVVSLYGTTGGSTATGGGSLYSASDATGYDGTATGSVTTIASAGANEAFRGVAFAPQALLGTSLPEVPVASVLPLVGVAAAGGVLLRRRRRRA